MAPLVGNRGWSLQKRVLLLDKEASMCGAGNFYERLTFSMGFHSRGSDLGQVGMSNVLSHDGDTILV